MQVVHPITIAATLWVKAVTQYIEEARLDGNATGAVKYQTLVKHRKITKASHQATIYEPGLKISRTYLFSTQCHALWRDRGQLRLRHVHRSHGAELA